MVDDIERTILAVMREAGHPLPSVWINNRANKRLGWEVAPAYVQAWLVASAAVVSSNDPILGEVFSLA